MLRPEEPEVDEVRAGPEQVPRPESRRPLLHHVVPDLRALPATLQRTHPAEQQHHEGRVERELCRDHLLPYDVPRRLAVQQRRPKVSVHHRKAPLEVRPVEGQADHGEPRGAVRVVVPRVLGRRAQHPPLDILSDDVRHRHDPAARQPRPQQQPRHRRPR
jgi:hypothetical protein